MHEICAEVDTQWLLPGSALIQNPENVIHFCLNFVDFSSFFCLNLSERIAQFYCNLTCIISQSMGKHSRIRICGDKGSWKVYDA